MPSGPSHPCKFPCPVTISSEEWASGKRRCPKHQSAKNKAIDSNRPSPTKRGYGPAHQRLRVLCFVRDAWRCQDPHCDVPGGWEPELVTLMRTAGMPVPSTAIMLRILTERFNAGLRHLHADHVRTIREAPELAEDLSNYGTKCNVCHARKTMLESVR